MINGILLNLNKHTVKSEDFTSFDEFAKRSKALININESNQSLYIQRNNLQPCFLFQRRLKDNGVIFTDIFTAAREHGDLLQKYFMTKAVKADEHQLTALHAAFVNGGVFLYVPKNVEINEPIHAIYLHDDAEANVFNHVIVVAEDNSSVTYVENYISTVDTRRCCV